MPLHRRISIEFEGEGEFVLELGTGKEPASRVEFNPDGVDDE